MEEVVMAVKTRPDVFAGLETNISDPAADSFPVARNGDHRWGLFTARK